MLVRSIRSSIIRVGARNFSCTAIVLQQGKGSNPYSASDKEDEERERLLREKFTQKVMNQGSPGYVDPRTPPNFDKVKQAKNPWQAFKAMQEVAREQDAKREQAQKDQPASGGKTTPREAMYKMFFYIVCIYVIVLVYQVTDADSQLSMLQGIPWWTQPLENTVYFLLVRDVLSRSEQQKIKADFSEAQKLNSSLTMPQFIQGTNPNLFAGHRTHPQEIVAALCGCFASTGDLKVATQMQVAVRGVTDKAECVDKIMDMLRQNYPLVFQPQQQQQAYAYPPQQQQMMMQQQQQQMQMQEIQPTGGVQETQQPAMIDPLATPTEGAKTSV